MKNKLIKLKNRLKVCWNILFGNYKHFIIFNIQNDDFIDFSKGYKYEVDFHWIGMNSYLSWCLLKDVSDMKTDVDMVLIKAKEQAEYELRKQGE